MCYMSSKIYYIHCENVFCYEFWSLLIVYYLILFLQYIWGINYLRGIPNLDPIYINLMLNKIKFLPSKTNRQIRKLEKEIDSMIVKVVKQRMETSYEKDLLQMLLEGAKNSGEYNGLCSRLRYLLWQVRHG